MAPLTDQKLTSRLLRLDADTRALLHALDSAPLSPELRPLHDLCVDVRHQLDRIFANDAHD